MCHILAFTGGEGRPGRTTVAWNMAAALGRIGFAVTVVDTGNGDGGILSYLGAQPPTTLHAWLSGACRWEEAVINIAERVSYSVLGESNCVGEAASLVRQFELLERLALQDFLLVDSDARTLTGRLPLVESASEVCAVVTPEQAAGTEALFFINRLYRTSTLERIGIVLNRAPLSEIADMICSRLEYDLRRILQVPAECVIEIPEEPLMAEAMRSGVPLAEYAPQCAAAQRIVEAAQRVADGRVKDEELNCLENFVKALASSCEVAPLRKPPPGDSGKVESHTKAGSVAVPVGAGISADLAAGALL